MYKERGFTLIELVIAMIVVGILGAVAFPKFINLKADARHSTTRAMLTALKSANVTVHAKAQLREQSDGTLDGLKVKNYFIEPTVEGLQSALEGSFGAAGSNADWIVSNGGGANSIDIKLRGAEAACKITYTNDTLGNMSYSVMPTYQQCGGPAAG